MTVVADLLIGWGSLNAFLVVASLTGVARRRYERRARMVSDRVAAASDSAPWA
jgi:hypothetical protein